LDYFRANAWANRQAASPHDRAAAWAWDQPVLQKQVYYLRQALNNEAFGSLETIRRCQILTNLANLLDTVGRFVEARAHWTQALAIDPDFWMARGNRGVGLMQYAKALYDCGHGAVFFLFAHRDLVKAADSARRHPHLGDVALANYFLQHAITIERVIEPSTVAKSYHPDGHALGETPEERRYRNWCLRETLFLNPLSDLEPRSIAARDVLTLPNFVTSLREPPVLIGLFNQMKQEFVSARWLLYEATHATEPHFSDHDVLLFNTLDYPAYGLATEKLKLAYRSIYSLFDKIAFFLNHYMSLGIAHNKIDFRTIWREKDGAPIRSQFEKSENWPLRGLYWLSKDLFKDGCRDSTEPEARDLYELRRHLEHRYLKVHEMLRPSHEASAPGVDPFFDNLAYALSRTDLERRSLRLMKRARAALIYLTLGMHREEERRREKRESSAICSIQLTPWDDRWKN
jgi:tetratricopeptide (TPR) repeat protein